jgi:hypothetical protein
MLSSALKSLNEFEGFVNQLNQSLTAKDLEKGDVLCEKALVEL